MCIEYFIHVCEENCSKRQIERQLNPIYNDDFNYERVNRIEFVDDTHVWYANRSCCFMFLEIYRFCNNSITCSQLFGVHLL